jgi:hypothetical protein
MTDFVFDELVKFLPEGYEQACRDMGAMRRGRVVKDPKQLLKLAAIHILNGSSLVEISAMAPLLGIGKLSDVAFMERFGKCKDWFVWMIDHLSSNGAVQYQKPDWLKNTRVLAVDATEITDKGRNHQAFRLHFALDLFQMHAVRHMLTGQEVGESLKNYALEPGDLVVADRAYGTLTSMSYCIDNKADFLLRFRSKACVIYDEDGKRIDILERLSALSDGEYLDLTTYGISEGKVHVPFRICAVRKDEDSCRATQKRLSRTQSKKQIEFSPETHEFNNFIVVATSLGEEVPASRVLALYRCRWQVELYFKRLKTLLGFGQMPKRHKKSAEAWLNGKILFAMLIEILEGQSQESFSP